MSRKERTLVHCWWECKLVQPLCKTVWRFLKKLKLGLPNDPSIPPLGIPKRNEIIISKRLSVLLCSLQYIIPNSQCLEIMPVNGRMFKENVVYIYIMKYYSVMRKKEILPFSITQMNLEGIMLSEIS